MSWVCHIQYAIVSTHHFASSSLTFLDTWRNSREIQRSKTYWQGKDDYSFVGRKCWTSSLECENCKSARHLSDIKISYRFHELTDIQLASSARDSRTVRSSNDLGQCDKFQWMNPCSKHQYNMPMYPREDAYGEQYTFSAQMMNFTAYTSPEGFACMVGKEAESTCSNMNSDITSCYNTRSYEKTVSLIYTIVGSIQQIRPSANIMPDDLKLYVYQPLT